jgi:hypothetical protein
MKILKQCSVAATIDAVNAVLFAGRRLTATERKAAGRWRADRQDKPRSYAGMIVPTTQEFPADIAVAQC